MDKKEAKVVISKKLKQLESLSYREFVNWIACRKVEVYEEVGDSGVKYQIEIEAMWDDKPEGAIRVMAGIDDGALLSALKPITLDFLITKDGAIK